MPITVKYTAICDGCNVVILDKEVSPSEIEDGVDLGEKVVFTQREELELVFHSDDCCYEWLKSRGHHSEAEEFKNTPWIASEVDHPRIEGIEIETNFQREARYR